MNSVELFSGAGGLALGLHRSGFRHLAVVERDSAACKTLERNQPVSPGTHWPIFPLDVAEFDYRHISGEIDLLAGGPPCQPFSHGGKRWGARDPRNMFPEIFRALVELEPKAILLENVPGLARAGSAPYLQYILLRLAHPEIRRRSHEAWRSHLERLNRLELSGTPGGELTYRVQHKILNAADFGIPQWRERLFVVAFRSDLRVDWRFPEPSHSFDALVWTQWITDTYWKRHGVARCRGNLLPREEHYLSTARRIFGTHQKPSLKPWLTVRDGLKGLPSPLDAPRARLIANHRHNPGGRTYAGHTGSRLDAPAKTLKAGDHGVPGGENMLSHANGRVRYFTIRECARLQTFPDSFCFPDQWTAAMRQIGNAVPVELAAVVGRSIGAALRAVRRSNDGSDAKRAKDERL